MEILKVVIQDFEGELTSYFVVNDDETEIKIVNLVSKEETSPSPFGSVTNQSVIDTYSMPFDERVRGMLEDTKQRAKSVEEVSVKNFNYQMKEISEKQLKVLTVEEPVEDNAGKAWANA